MMTPALGIFVGILAAGLSVWFYQFIAPLLMRWLLFDTWGIFHLHFAPGILGGILSAIFWATFADQGDGFYTTLLHGRTSFTQGGYQIIALLWSLTFGILGGCLAGGFLYLFRLVHVPYDTFGDHVFWKTEFLNNDTAEVQNIQQNQIDKAPTTARMDSSRPII